MFSTTGRACNEIYPILQLNLFGKSKKEKE